MHNIVNGGNRLAIIIINGSGGGAFFLVVSGTIIILYYILYPALSALQDYRQTESITVHCIVLLLR